MWQQQKPTSLVVWNVWIVRVGVWNQLSILQFNPLRRLVLVGAHIIRRQLMTGLFQNWMWLSLLVDYWLSVRSVDQFSHVHASICYIVQRSMTFVVKLVRLVDRDSRIVLFWPIFIGRCWVAQLVFGRVRLGECKGVLVVVRLLCRLFFGIIGLCVWVMEEFGLNIRNTLLIFESYYLDG